MYYFNVFQEIQRGNPNFNPIDWQGIDGEQFSSSAYPLAYLADSPEKSALNGQLSHSAAQGCTYCLQIAKSINHRMCYEYLPDTAMKTHNDVLEQAEIWRCSSASERNLLLKNHETKGFKRPSVVSGWEKFDMIQVIQKIYIDTKNNI